MRSLGLFLRLLQQVASDIFGAHWTPSVAFASLLLSGCLGRHAGENASCMSDMVRFRERASPAIAQQIAAWSPLWNQSLSFGVSDRPNGRPLSRFVPDSVMEPLARDSATGIWSLAYVVANENASGLTVAANAAQLYAERQGPARPMLVMLHDFRPSPHRLAIGLSAIRTPLDSIDLVAVHAISCELRLQDTLPLPRRADWEWFPASQWTGGLNEVDREVQRLLLE